jgi:predicted RNA-binding Zn ribbon-like protein
MTAVSNPASSPIPTNASEFACIDFVNSAFTDYRGDGGAHFDRLPLGEWQSWFLARHGLDIENPGRVPVSALSALRDDLRGILEKFAKGRALTTSDAEVLDSWVKGVQLRRRVTRTAGGVELTLEPRSRDWAWVMSEVGSSTLDLVSSQPSERLKVCANPACSWMFYDQTLNNSKQFCSKDACGTLMRVRRFRGTRHAV